MNPSQPRIDMMTNDYPGSRWFKFDFHNHTPASLDTHWARHDPDFSPEQWLLSYMQAEIDCVAVTDHNSGEWIDKLKTEYSDMCALVEILGEPTEGFRPLTIFPGVEITVNGGIHILAIFDPSATTATINKLLGAVGYNGESGNSGAVTTQSIQQVIQIIHEHGGIAIPAHVDKESGLLEMILLNEQECNEEQDQKKYQAKHNATTLKQIFDLNLILAIEKTDPTSPTPKHVKNTVDPLASVLGSDNHGYPKSDNNKPGSRYTWIKMAQPTLEGLRLALIDGNDFSVKRSDSISTDPNLTPDVWVRSISITNTRFMGNKTPEIFRFSPYYNAIIGGRGTGKSSVVHCLRLGLGRGSELNGFSELNKQFSAFNVVPKGRDQSGALRDTSTITVEFTRDEVLEKVTWNNQGIPHAIETFYDGQWRSASSQELNFHRFPIRIFSQGQIAEMAGKGRQFLLNIIDENANVAELKQQLESHKTTFFVQRAQARKLQAALVGRAEVERNLAEVQQKLEALNKSHFAETFKKYERMRRQQQQVQDTIENLNALPRQIEGISESFILDDWHPNNFNASEDPEILAWRQEVDAITLHAQQQLQEMAKQLAQSIAELTSHTLLDSWGGRLKSIENDYNQIKESLAVQGVADPQTMTVLLQKKQNLELQLKQLGELDKEAETLKEYMNEQWTLIKTTRQEIAIQRDKFLKEHLSGNSYVQMTLIPFGFDARVIEADLRTVLNLPDDRFETEILKLDESDNPSAGIAYHLAEAASDIDRINSIKKEIRSRSSKFGKRFVEYLAKQQERPEFNDHLLCWFPEDDLKITYSRKGDGGDWVDIVQGSQGQRSAALLAFLLAFGDEPLIMDQPEDDLDNNLIYDLIVQQIKSNKIRRQLIIITHNPNIVVNGDADMVYALDFRGGQCRITEKGALQETAIRKEVCRIMEGGQEAFSRRWYRLGLRG